MGWLLAIAAIGVYLFATRTSSVSTFQNDDGTWGFRASVGPRAVEDLGPYASQAAAATAAASWMAENAAQQGAVAPPPVAPPLPPVPPPDVAPYLRVTSPPVSALATATAGGASWVKYGGTGGDQSGDAPSAAAASSDLLSAVNASLPASAPVTIELRRADGPTRRSVVSQINLQTWQWSIVTPPAVAGGVGTSKTDASWRTLSRLASMRAALAMLQGGG